MADAPRFRLTWTLTVETGEPDVLARALEPETDGHHTLEASEDALVARGEGGPGEALHTLDDLLACLTAAMGALGEE